MPRKYREVTYQEPVGRGVWGWIKILAVIVIAIIIIAAVL